MSSVYSRDSPEIEALFSETLAILEIADRLNDSIKPTLMGKRFYTDAQLAEKLNISRRTLQDYRDSGMIAYYRFDGKILYADDDVAEMLKSHYRPKF